MTEMQISDTPTFLSVPRRSKLLRVAEVLDRLAIGRTRFYELVAKGRIPVVRLGASSRVPEAALEDFVASLPAAGKRAA